MVLGMFVGIKIYFDPYTESSISMYVLTDYFKNCITKQLFLFQVNLSSFIVFFVIHLL